MMTMQDYQHLAENLALFDADPSIATNICIHDNVGIRDTFRFFALYRTELARIRPILEAPKRRRKMNRLRYAECRIKELGEAHERNSDSLFSIITGKNNDGKALKSDHEKVTEFLTLLISLIRDFPTPLSASDRAEIAERVRFIMQLTDIPHQKEEAIVSLAQSRLEIADNLNKLLRRRQHCEEWLENYEIKIAKTDIRIIYDTLNKMNG